MEISTLMINRTQTMLTLIEIIKIKFNRLRKIRIITIITSITTILIISKEISRKLIIQTMVILIQTERQWINMDSKIQIQKTKQNSNNNL